MNRELINLQTKRVETEIHFLSAKVANAVEQASSMREALSQRTA